VNKQHSGNIPTVRSSSSHCDAMFWQPLLNQTLLNSSGYKWYFSYL